MLPWQAWVRVQRSTNNFYLGSFVPPKLEPRMRQNNSCTGKLATQPIWYHDVLCSAIFEDATIDRETHKTKVRTIIGKMRCGRNTMFGIQWANVCLLQHLENMCLGHGSPSISSLPFMYLRSFFIAVLKLSSRKASFRYQSHSSSSFCTLSFFWKMFGEGTLSQTRSKKKYQQARGAYLPKNMHTMQSKMCLPPIDANGYW